MGTESPGAIAARLDKPAVLAELDRLEKTFGELIDRDLRLDRSCSWCAGGADRRDRVTVRGGNSPVDVRAMEQAVLTAGRLLCELMRLDVVTLREGIDYGTGPGDNQWNEWWFVYLGALYPEAVETGPVARSDDGYVVECFSMNRPAKWGKLAVNELRQAVKDADDQPANAMTEPDLLSCDNAAAMRQIMAAIGDDNAAKIHAIANSTDHNASEKMALIVRLDQRWEGKNSAEWSTLLGVRPQAVRQTDWWKENRPKPR